MRCMLCYIVVVACLAIWVVNIKEQDIVREGRKLLDVVSSIDRRHLLIPISFFIFLDTSCFDLLGLDVGLDLVEGEGDSGHRSLCAW
ncbi:hypothetical protein B0J14DRAFT_199457 [Halenospora varia]|nr:hypothetical protein B0J14DRAFT_199457 [Halenospora varia]